MGSRGALTGKLLWDEIKRDSIKQVITDEWAAYREFIPRETHVQSKAETFTVEGYNSLFRHFLARLRRKSKCYSKCVHMLKYSAMLLMLKWNGGLQSILN